ncbi:mucin-3B, partial [Fukomys damarensis]|uniref:mucin-3B n=1 Tax=Fukomys damarensis TaxID=885580 RepID=UPI0014552A02
MLLPGLLGLLWMLRAPLGATGTLSVASKPPFSALSHATSTQAATQPPPNSPVPRDRENTPTSLTKATSETPLSSPVPSEASTTPKFVIRVETTPPTLLVYTPNTECVNPPRLGVTSTYSTTTCVPRTPVPHSGSSYTMTLGTDKPVTPTTSPATTMISPPTVEDPPSTSGPLPDTTRHSLTSTTRATERTTLLPSSVHRVSPILGTTSVSAAISSLTPTKPVSVTASTHTGLLSTPLTPGTLSTMAVPTATPTITRISSETTSTGPPATTAATSQTTVTTPSGTYTGQPTLRHTSDFSTASLKRESIFTTLNASSKATKNALFSETSSTSPVSTASPSTSHSTPSFTHSSSHPTYSTPTTVTSSPATSLDTTETSTSTTQSSLRTHPPTIPTTSLPTSSLGSTDSTSSHTAPSTAHTLSHTSLSSSSMHSAQTPQPDSTALTLTPGLTTTLTGAGSTITLATSVPGTPDTSITMSVSPLLTSVSQTPNSPAPSEFPADASDSSPTLSSLTQTPSLPLSSLTPSSDVPVTNTRLSTPKTSVSTPIFLTSVTSSGESSTEWFPQGSTSTNAVITSIGTLIPSTPSVVMSSPPPSISSDLVLTSASATAT